MDREVRNSQVRVKILEFIIDYTSRHGYPPSYRDMQDGVGIVASAVKRHIRYLIDARVIAQDLGKARSIRIADADLARRFISRNTVGGNDVSR